MTPSHVPLSIPLRAMIASAQRVFAARHENGRFGVRAQRVTIDLPAALQRTRGITSVLRGSATVGERERALPDIAGIEDIPVWWPEDVLSAVRLPRSIATLGGGPVGCGLATHCSLLGVETTLIEHTSHILPEEDEEVALFAAHALERRGAHVRTGTLALSVRKDGRMIALTMQRGRAPRRTIRVARVVIAQEEASVDRATPQIIATLPEVARVGLTPVQARAKNIPVHTLRAPYRLLARAAVDGTRDGMVKVLVHARRDTIIGVHIIGNHAGELVHEASAAMKAGMSWSKFRALPRAPLSYSELFAHVT